MLGIGGANNFLILVGEESEGVDTELNEKPLMFEVELLLVGVGSINLGLFASA